MYTDYVLGFEYCFYDYHYWPIIIDSVSVGVYMCVLDSP